MVYCRCPPHIHKRDRRSPGSEAYLSELKKLIEDDREEGGSKRIISIGEIGLGESSSFLPRLVADDETDFDRLHFSPSETQLKHLPTLLQFSKTFNLPLFLHSRTSDAHRDLVKVLRDVGWDGEGWAGGVVHSFTGTTDEMKELVNASPRFQTHTLTGEGGDGLIYRDQWVFTQDGSKSRSGQSCPSG